MCLSSINIPPRLPPAGKGYKIFTHYCNEKVLHGMIRDEPAYDSDDLGGTWIHDPSTRYLDASCIGPSYVTGFHFFANLEQARACFNTRVTTPYKLITYSLHEIEYDGLTADGPQPLLDVTGEDLNCHVGVARRMRILRDITQETDDVS